VCVSEKSNYLPILEKAVYLFTFGKFAVRVCKVR
jgi:hypothetical protein